MGKVGLKFFIDFFEKKIAIIGMNGKK